jgi:hypothetical protein
VPFRPSKPSVSLLAKCFRDASDTCSSVLAKSEGGYKRERTYGSFIDIIQPRKRLSLPPRV